MTRIGLAVTIHDPEERHLPKLRPALNNLREKYGAKAAACSPETSERTLAELRSLGFELTTSADGNIGEARRRALHAVLARNDEAFFQYIDLDRLLHWYYSFPDELQSFLNEARGADYTAVGRTERAFFTHPVVQIRAETLTNDAFSTTTGLPSMDLVAGCCVMSRDAATTILRRSIEPSNATDLEWPAIVLTTLGRPPAFKAVEGLEFETCDYYEGEIANAGSKEAWMRSIYDQPRVWAGRAKLAYDSIAALERVLATDGKGGRRYD